MARHIDAERLVDWDNLIIKDKNGEDKQVFDISEIPTANVVPEKDYNDEYNARKEAELELHMLKDKSDKVTEEFKKKIEYLEAENREIRECSRKMKDADERLFDRWNDLEQLLTSISTCVRFVDKEKAFDEIMELFNEVVG